MGDVTAADPRALARRIAERFALVPEVVAFVVAGSLAAGTADAHSDVDGYCYQSAAVPVSVRRAIAAEFADQAEIDNRFWETGDEWVDRASGTHCDIMYRAPDWLSDQLDRAVVRHEASVGYSSCLWYNILHSTALHDPTGWYAVLQARAAVPYPEPLRRAIVAKNHPILRANVSSYRRQIALALLRDDPISVQHRLTAVLASYFDILCAVNRQPHPGEKRLLAFAERQCPLRPPTMAADMRQMLAAGATRDDAVLAHLDRVLDGLDALLADEGLLPDT